ncbi:MAG: hypothetical protein ACRCV3_02970 [Desulfovibrionaceae bacterium]
MTRIFLSLFLLLCTACSHTTSSPPLENTVIPPPNAILPKPLPIYKSVEDKRRAGQDTLIYPALILQNKKNETFLNEYIRKKIYTPYIGFIIKQKQCLTQALKKSPFEERKQTDFCQKFFANSSFSAPYLSTNYISFIIQYSEFLNDGKKHYSEFFLNFNRKKESILQLEDLFLPNTAFLSFLTSLIIKQSNNPTLSVTQNTPFSLSQEALILKPTENVVQKILWKDISHILTKNSFQIEE